jgi:hypothetical protein
MPTPFDSVVDKLLEKKLAESKQKELIIERVEDYKKALDAVFASPEGKMMAKYMMRFMDIFNADPSFDGARLLEEKARRSYYTKMIRPFISKKRRMEIENNV